MPSFFVDDLLGWVYDSHEIEEKQVNAKMKKWILMLLCMLLACTTALAQSVSVLDMYDREITLDKPARRIVALSAADCEILCALGCEELLVGRGTYCDYPGSILDVPVVESGAQTNVEQIIALSPEVVLMSDMAQSVDVVNALEAAGIRVAVSNADTIEGVYSAIRMIGKLVGREAEAEALIADMQSAFDGIRAASDSQTVYFEVSPLQWGLWTAGSGTFMDEIAQMCGLTNIFSDVNGWAEVSEEQVLSRNPDIIVTTTMYFDEGPTPAEEIYGRAGWTEVSAVRQGRVFHVDSDQITRPGPRLKDAALALYAFLNEP